MSTPTVVNTEIPAELDWEATCEACEENPVNLFRRLACGCGQMRCDLCHLIFIAGLHLRERLYPASSQWHHGACGNDPGCSNVVSLTVAPIVPQIIVAEVQL
jgi:hypothetical protein